MTLPTEPDGDPTDGDPTDPPGVMGSPESEDPVAEDPVAEDPVAEDPVAEDPVVEDPVVDALGQRDVARLRDRLPLPKRRLTRVQVIALVLFSALALGPLGALVVILRADTDTQPQLATDTTTKPSSGGVHLDLTVIWVNPITGELGVRAQLTPDESLLIAGGRLRSDLTIASNDVRGNRVTKLPAGQPTGPVEIVTGLRAGSISRYPFDRYSGSLQLILSQQDASGTRQEVPATMTVYSVVSDLGVAASIRSVDAVAIGRTVSFGVQRNTPTLVFTIWMMVLWWALSISAVLFVWSVAIWRATVPPWGYGYMVGVLFALTPLRGALPGSPPPGVLVDYVSFYWAIVIVGVALLMLLAYFIRDVREQNRRGVRN